LFSDLGNLDHGPVEAPRPNIRPTRANLNWAFETWLPSRIRPDDLVVFYYAGRVGTAVATSSPLRPSREDYYLLPIDGNHDNMPGSGLVFDHLLDDLVRRTSGRCRVVCWLATTVGGGPSGPRGPGAAGSTRAGARATVPNGRDWLNRLARWPGVVAW